MVLRQVCLLVVACCATLQVCAQEAAPAEPAPAPAEPQAAKPAPPPSDAKTTDATPTAEAPVPLSSTLAEGEVTAEKIMAMQKAGYKLKNENGQVLFCRQDLQTGSRLRQKTSCMTAREWEQLQAENTLQLKSLERRPRMVRQ